MATDSRTPMRYNQHAMDDRDTFTGGSETERLDPMDEAYEAINKPPVATCPECDEYVWVELTELGICESCKDERCTLEVEQARNARLPGENNQSWVARCNEVLRVYGWTPDMQYCPDCAMPTEHVEMWVEDDPCETYPGAPAHLEYRCSRCD